MTNYNYSNEEIKKKVIISLDHLFRKDHFLLKNSVHERAIAARLFLYLKKLFPKHTVDCEYDKHGEQARKILMGIKECSKKKKNDYVIPDIIIHTRNIDKNNLLVIEIKKNRKDSCDIKKLEKFTDQSGIFGYKLGLFIKFNLTNEPSLIWFEDGKEITL